MAYFYRETVEAVQFVKAHKSIMDCIDLAVRGGFKDNWILSSDSLKLGSDGMDGHVHYVSPGQWLVLRGDDVLHVIKDDEFQRRFAEANIPKAATP